MAAGNSHAVSLNTNDGRMEQDGWTFNALQFGLLGNTPAICLRHKTTGESMVIDPAEILTLDIEVDRKTVFAAAYLKGYSECYYDDTLGTGLSQLMALLRGNDLGN